MKPTLLILTSSFPKSLRLSDGGEYFVLNLAKEQLLDFRVIVVTHYLLESKTFENLNGIEVYRFKFLPINSLYKFFNHGILAAFSQKKFLLLFLPFYIASQLFKTYKLIKLKNVKIIHAHWLIPQGLIAIINKILFRKIKVVCTSHGSDLNYFKEYNFIKKIILKNIDYFFPVSRHLASKAFKIFSSKNVSIIPMGTSIPKQFDKKNNQKVKKLIYVGRLSYVKGCMLLPEIMFHLKESGVSSTLTVYGDGELRNDFLEKCKELNIRELINYQGFISNNTLLSLLKEYSIMIMPSFNEGAPVAMMEAFARGVVVLSSDAEAYLEHITDGLNGFIAQKGNAKSFADKIIQLKNDEVDLVKIANNAYSYSQEHFSWQKIGEKYNSYLNQLI